MKELTIRNGAKYVVSKIVPVKEGKHEARLVIDSKDQPQFKGQNFHRRAEILVEKLGDVVEGAVITLKASAPVFVKDWENAGYKNFVNVYSHGIVEVVGA